MEVVHACEGGRATGGGESVRREFDDEDDGVGIAAASATGGGELTRAAEDAGDGGDCVSLEWGGQLKLQSSKKQRRVR